MRKIASLGHFQAVFIASLSGFAGASALIAGNVRVSTADGPPTLKGIALRKSGQKAGASQVYSQAFVVDVSWKLSSD